MKRIIRTAICMSLVSLLAPTANAQVKQTSDLFPDSTVAYFELTGVKHLATEIGSLAKGSFLDDFPGSLEKFKPKTARNRYFMFNEMAYFANFLTPHGLGEMSKLEGGAFAVLETPVDLRKSARVIGVLRTGDSNLAHFSMQMIALNLRPVAKVEGETLFQSPMYGGFDEPAVAPGGLPQAQPPQRQTYGPVIAMPKGVIIIGSHKDDVADMIRRLKGKGKGPSLTHDKNFMQAAQIRPKGGLFAYADMKTVMQLPGMLGNLFYGGHGASRKYEDKEFEKKEEAQPESECGFQPNQKRTMSGTEDLLRSFGSLGRIALGLSLENGAFEIVGRINTDPKSSSGWMDFFTKRTLKRDLLHYVPAERSTVFAFAMPDGSAFWDKLDKTAPVFETDISFTLGARVLDIAQFVVASPDSKRGTSPLFVVEAVNAQKANGLASALAKALRMESTVNGAVIVLSRDAKVAREAMALGQAKKGMLALPWVAKATENLGVQHVALVTSIGSLLQDAMRSTIVQHNHFDKKADFVPGAFPPGAGPQPNQKPVVNKQFQKFTALMGKAWAEVPPLVIALGKTGRDFQFQGKQGGLRKTTAQCLDVWMHYYTHWTATRRY